LRGDPVTGKKAFVMMGKEQEIAVDRKHSPHQFSEDYGIAQDSPEPLCRRCRQPAGKVSHRPDMPYRFHAVNANYVNAYAFPAARLPPRAASCWRWTTRMHWRR
jgi:beta-barrel assembly-enhancing protease